MSQDKPLLYGINKMYYAVRTESGGESSYTTPQRLPGARQISINAEGSTEKFYADNGVYYMATSNTGRSGSVEVVGLSDQALIDLFGYVRDDNGVLLEASDAKSANVALLFECENDGSKPTRFVMYDVKFTRPTEEHNTKEESVSVDTLTMDYEAAPCEFAFEGSKRPFVGGHIDHSAQTASTYDSWYSAVSLPSKAAGSAGSTGATAGA